MTSDYFFIAAFHLTIPTNDYTSTSNTNKRLHQQRLHLQTATPTPPTPTANAHAGNGYTNNAHATNFTGNDRTNGGITSGSLHNRARPSTLSNITRTRTLAGLLFVPSYYLENAGPATAQ